MSSSLKDRCTDPPPQDNKGEPGEDIRAKLGVDGVLSLVNRVVIDFVVRQLFGNFSLVIAHLLNIV